MQPAAKRLKTDTQKGDGNGEESLEKTIPGNGDDDGDGDDGGKNGKLNRELTRREKSAMWRRMRDNDIANREQERQQQQQEEQAGEKEKEKSSAITSDDVHMMKEKEKRRERLGPKRKVAVFIGYNGNKYDGLQINPGMHTVSKVLSEAMVRVGCIAEENAHPLSKVKWMYASRTDKRVHALVNIVSLMMVMVRGSMDEIAELINSELPEDVRVLGISRVVNSFHPQRMCDGRLYEYIIPTYAFKHTGPIEQSLESIDDSAPMQYRISEEELKRVNELLARYCGTLSFHNYTKRENYVPAALKRYIMSFTCGEPFMNNGIECVVLSVKGQSFMVHQIRRMVGAVVAVMRGMIREDVFAKSFDVDQNMRVPCAPGDGLLLAEMYFDNFNRRHAATHGAVSTDRFNESRNRMRQQLYDFIMGTEAKERIMAEWVHSDLVRYLNSSHPTYDKTNTGDGTQDDEDDGADDDDVVDK